MIQTARSQSKCKDILASLKSENLHMRSYLKSQFLVKTDQQLLFAVRSNSYPVKANFHSQYSDMICRSCGEANSYEDIQHLLCCDSLIDKSETTKISVSDIFGSLSDQIRFIKIFKKISNKREVLLDLKSKYPSN